MTAAFLGMPVTGEIVRAHPTIAVQRPLEDFAPIFKAVLDDPTIQEFGWLHYPYCSDNGCDRDRFSAYGTWVRTCDDDPDAEPWQLEVQPQHPTLGNRTVIWSREAWAHVPGPYEGPDEDRFNRCLALSDAVADGQFDRVLQDAFGLRAEITVSRSGITVELCDTD